MSPPFSVSCRYNGVSLLPCYSPINRPIWNETTPAEIPIGGRLDAQGMKRILLLENTKPFPVRPTMAPRPACSCRADVGSWLVYICFQKFLIILVLSLQTLQHLLSLSELWRSGLSSAADGERIHLSVCVDVCVYVCFWVDEGHFLEVLFNFYAPIRSGITDILYVCRTRTGWCCPLFFFCTSSVTVNQIFPFNCAPHSFSLCLGGTRLHAKERRAVWGEK